MVEKKEGFTFEEHLIDISAKHGFVPGGSWTEKALYHPAPSQEDIEKIENDVMDRFGIKKDE